MICPTCNAPAVVLDGRCVFCRTPVPESHAPAELLDYLEARLPVARTRRFGIVRKRGVRELDVAVEGEEFKARIERSRLVLTPDLTPARWIDRLLAALSRAAAGDAELRAALTKAGWALR